MASWLGDGMVSRLMSDVEESQVFPCVLEYRCLWGIYFRSFAGLKSSRDTRISYVESLVRKRFVLQSTGFMCFNYVLNLKTIASYAVKHH